MKKYLISKSCSNCNHGNYPIILAELTLKNFDKEIKHYYAHFVWRDFKIINRNRAGKTQSHEKKWFHRFV